MRVEAQVFVVNSEKAKGLKANTTVILDGKLELKGKILDSKNGPFHTWKGTEPYKKKDGTDGFAHPIFVKDKDLNATITNAVMAKYNSLSGRRTSTSEEMNQTPEVDSSFTSDDIPF